MKNPLLFFDIESTGLSIVNDRIVEISMVKLTPGAPGEPNKKEVKTRRVNPGIPISAEATAVHGITDEDVKDEPFFYQIARSMAEFMKGCDIAGYNSLKFDIPMLAEEFLRARDEHNVNVDFDFRKRKLIDVQNIFYKKEPRTLKAAYMFYCNEDLEKAHSAEADTEATRAVLEAQLDRYGADENEPLQNSVDFLAKYTCPKKFVDYAGRIILNDKDEPVFNFGKHKGKKVTDVFQSERSYYSWMMDGDFSRDTKNILTAIYTEMFQKGTVR